MDDTRPQLEQPLPRCSICLNDPPVNGVQIKCGHIFCYSCIKNASETTGVCALCRAELGFEFSFQEHHHVLGTLKLPSSTSGFYWFYGSSRGWWLYDAEPNDTIETAYQRGDTKIDLYLTGSGGIYAVDLIHMTQKRKDEHDARERKICRATLEMDNILGLAGLKGRDATEALDVMKTISAQSNM